MRIAILGLYHESNTFAEHATSWSDFTDYDWFEGDALRAAMADSNNEIGGMFTVLDEAGDGVEVVPVLYAAALPAGRITEDAEERLWRAASDALAEAGPIDGVLAAPHGAAVGQAHPDFDGWWLGRLRELVGPTVPIVVTLDPHANVSSAMVDAADALVAYRTNPHVDQRGVGREAAELLLGHLRGEVDLDCARVSLPMVLNIERQLTDDPPCCDWVEKGRLLAAEDGVLATSLILGYPYADVAEMGLSVLVVTDRRVSSTLARQVAKDWADHIWSDRERARPELVAMYTAARAVADAADLPVGLLDIGDNIGGGSYGDQTALAHASIRCGALPLFVALSDAEALKACVAAGIGGDVDIHVGGRHEPQLCGPPLPVRGQVENLTDGQWTDPAPRHGGRVNYDEGLTAIVRTPEGLVVQLSERPIFPASLGQMTHAGLDPRSFRALIIKGVHAPVAAYRDVVSQLIRVNSPGPTSADITKWNYQNRRRPMFPFEAEATFP